MCELIKDCKNGGGAVQETHPTTLDTSCNKVKNIYSPIFKILNPWIVVQIIPADL